MQNYWGGPQASLNKAQLFFDGWGKKIHYELRKSGFKLTSAGANHTLHDSDDIVKVFDEHNTPANKKETEALKTVSIPGIMETQ